MSKILALFDFDGTITKNDSLLKFIRFAVGDIKFIYGLVILSPTLIAFKLKLMPNYEAKEKMLSWFFKEFTKNNFVQIANEYSLNHIDKILRPKAIERLNWHKNKGHNVVVVSASLESWLKPWCDRNNLDLIATQILIENNKVTGKLASNNCHGQEKVNRIKDKYDISSFDYIYAYGDSSGDKEMLELANEKAYKPFR
jgi:phosphatidylglycerophosphatase C